nr:ABC transporter permease [Nocardia farcinica]
MSGEYAPAAVWPPDSTDEQRASAVLVLRGRILSAVRTFGRTVRLGVRATVLAATDLAAGRFPLREAVVQAWFFASVSLLPAILISLPMGVVIAVQVGSLTENVGAGSMAGAVGGMGVMQQIAPLAAALLVGGAGASAIASDLGARTIREEIDALRTMGIDPHRRLVAPRVVAMTVVAPMLAVLVILMSILASFLVASVGQGVAPGSYWLSFGSFASVTDVVSAAPGGQWTTRPSPYRPPGLRWTLRTQRAWDPLEELGFQLRFGIAAVAGAGWALRRYRAQVVAVFTDLAWGNGRAVIVGGGVAPVLVVMGVVAGAMIGLVGITALDTLGMGPLAGAMSALANPRELAPLIAAVGFAAQAGCRMTAEIGAMRIAEEIDALEAQAIDPIPYVVSTRLLAAVLTVVPTYLIALALGFLTTKLTVTAVHGEAAGSFEHYFQMFVEPRDLVYSLVKVVIFVVIVTGVHAYQGFYATGGPEGVGVASGRAIRASLVLIATADMVLTIAMWGFDTEFGFGG